jgi:hypothetical protein
LARNVLAPDAMGSGDKTPAFAGTLFGAHLPPIEFRSIIYVDETTSFIVTQ